MGKPATAVVVAGLRRAILARLADRCSRESRPCLVMTHKGRIARGQHEPKAGQGLTVAAAVVVAVAALASEPAGAIGRDDEIGVAAAAV